MRTRFHLIILLALGILFVSACTTRQLRPVATVDHTPFLKAVTERRSTLETGISGTLEMNFKKGGKRFRGKSYIVAYPNGHFRLEIPGPWGSTVLVMRSDGNEILAYYPEKAKAYRSLAEGRSLNPYLPFPLPVDPAMIPALMMGISPGPEEIPGEITGEVSERVSEAIATLMDSGEINLQARWEASGPEFDYLFAKGSETSLSMITTVQNNMSLKVMTDLTPPHLPRSFTITSSDASMKGEWRSASLFKGTESDLVFQIPDNVTVIDLEQEQ